MTTIFLTDGYTDRPSDPRAVLEERIRNLRARLWSDPGDRREIEGMIEQAEAELRALDRGEAAHG
jgi:hypothetical protein